MRSQILALAMVTLFYFTADNRVLSDQPGNCTLTQSNTTILSLKSICEDLFNQASTGEWIQCRLQVDNIQNCSICFNCSLTNNITTINMTHMTSNNLTGGINCTNVSCQWFNTRSSSIASTPLPTTPLSTTTMFSTPTMFSTEGPVDMSIMLVYDTVWGSVTALLVATVVALGTGWACTCVVMKRNQTARVQTKNTRELFLEDTPQGGVSSPPPYNKIHGPEYENISLKSEQCRENAPEAGVNTQSCDRSDSNGLQEHKHVLEPRQLTVQKEGLVSEDPEGGGEAVNEIEGQKGLVVRNQAKKEHYYYLLEPSQFSELEEENRDTAEENKMRQTVPKNDEHNELVESREQRNSICDNPSSRGHNHYLLEPSEFTEEDKEKTRDQCGKKFDQGPSEEIRKSEARKDGAE